MHRWDLVNERLGLSPRDKETWAGEGLRTTARVICMNMQKGFMHMHVFSHSESCLTLCDLSDWSPRGSSVHGIFQARILKWVADSFSRGSSWSRDRTCVSSISCIAGGFFTAEPLGKAGLRGIGEKRRGEAICTGQANRLTYLYIVVEFQVSFVCQELPNLSSTFSRVLSSLGTGMGLWLTLDRVRYLK